MVEIDHKAARRLALLKEHDLELPASIENRLIDEKDFCGRSQGNGWERYLSPVKKQADVEIITRAREELIYDQSAVYDFMKTESLMKFFKGAKVGGIHA